MSPGIEAFKAWVVSHYDPLIWTALGLGILVIALLAFVWGYTAGSRDRGGRAIYRPEELA